MVKEFNKHKFQIETDSDEIAQKLSAVINEVCYSYAHISNINLKYSIEKVFEDIPSDSLPNRQILKD